MKSPTTAAGKTRSAQTALKHGIGGQEYIVLPEEDTAEFAALEAALLAELAPVGALQSVLARRVAIAAWRLARADRIEAELFEEHRFADGRLGLVLIRDGNGTRSFETLLRIAARRLAEFWRALRTLKALQAEQAASTGPVWRRAPWRCTPRRPRQGHRSSSVQSRTNPSAPAPSPDRNTLCLSRPRPGAACTSLRRHGCRPS